MPLYLLFAIAFPLGMVWVETHPVNGPTLCLFRQTTNLDCPSCGLTRAFRAMGRLDVIAAIHYNPLGPAVFLGALAFWCYALALLLTGGRARMPDWWQRRQTVLLWSALTIFLLVGFARMAYEVQHPLSRPAPTRFHLSGRE